MKNRITPSLNKPFAVIALLSTFTLTLLIASATVSASTSGSSTHQQAYKKGDWIIRVGITNVDPDSDSTQLSLNGSRSAFINAVGSEKLNVDSDSQLGLTVEYFVHANWGIELLAASPFNHTAKATNTLSGLEIVDAKQLPPTLSAIYHLDTNTNFQPYIGLGVNYTIFFNEGLTSEASTAFQGLGLTGASIKLEDSWGVSAQLGFDYLLSDRWLVNASARWMDIETEASISFSNGSQIKTDIDIDPMVYSLMVGYRF